MSVPAFAWALEQGRSHRLSASDRIVLIYLADKANGARVCWPGQETIAEWTGLTSRTVRAALGRLAKTGLIRLEERPGKVTSYHIQREDNPEPRKQFPGYTPAIASGVGGQTPAMVSGDPGNSCTPPRKLTARTPEAISAEPVLTKYEPKKEAFQKLDGMEGREGKEESPPPDPNAADPLDRPVDPKQFASLIGSIARGFQNNYPPRAAILDPRQQREVIEAATPPRSKPLPPEYIAAMRHAAGYGAQIRQGA